MRLPLALGAALALSAPAFAGDLIPELVPADARWLAHADVEGFLDTALWRSLKELGDALEFEAELAEAREEFGVDPLGLVKSVTLYGFSGDHEEGVAVLVTAPQVDEVLARFQEQPGYSSEKVGGRTLHQWGHGDYGDEDDAAFVYVRSFEGVENRLVFVSDSRERLLAGIDVLEGKRADITQVREPALRIRPAEGSIVYLETSEDIPGLGEVEEISAVAALAKGLRFDLGELGGMLFAELTVTTENGKDAQNLASVLQGATALLNLVLDGPEADLLRPVVNALQFNTNANVVGVEFRYDSHQLVKLMQELHEHH